MSDPRRTLIRTVQPIIGLALVFGWPGPQIARQLRAQPEPVPVPHLEQVVDPGPDRGGPEAPEDWLATIRPSCTRGEVMLATDLNPAPTTGEGPALEAACFAIAGDIAKARSLVLAMEPGQRPEAAGVILDVALESYPADSDPAVAPVMDLVLEFWPNHPLALYHAGAVRYRSGDARAAAPYLERFLIGAGPADSLAREARRMLDRRPRP